MILTVGVLLAVAAEVLACVVLKYLSWSRIRSWFSKVATVFTDDRSHLRVTLHERLKTGQHRVVYGIFNRQTSTFVDGESVTADTIDPELAAFHQGTPLVVYSD